MLRQCLKVAVTGSMGMGKSSVAKHFNALGFPVFDADAVVHKLYARGGLAVPAVAVLCPEAVVDGAVNRSILSSKIKSDAYLLPKIEEVVHPLVELERDNFCREAEKAHHLLVIFDIPLFLEKFAHDSNSITLKEQGAPLGGMDHIVVATADRHIQEERILARGKMSPETMRMILSKQLPDEVKQRMADFVVHTDLGEGFVCAKAQVAKITEEIIRRNPGHWRSWVGSYIPTPISTTVGDAPVARAATAPCSSTPPANIAVDTVIFDLDDTLADFHPIISDATDAMVDFVRTNMPRTYLGVEDLGAGTGGEGGKRTADAPVAELDDASAASLRQGFLSRLRKESEKYART